MPVSTQRFIAADQAAAVTKIGTLSMVTELEEAAVTAVGGVPDESGRALLVTMTQDIQAGGASFVTRRVSLDVESIVSV